MFLEAFYEGSNIFIFNDFIFKAKTMKLWLDLYIFHD